MTAAIDSSVPDLDQHRIPRSSLTEASSHPSSTSSERENEQNALGEPAPCASFVELLLPKNTPPSPSMATSSTEGAVAVVAISQERTRLSLDLDHAHSKPAAVVGVSLPGESRSKDPIQEKAIYPPPVSPTQTYQPPVPSLSMMHVTKSPVSVVPPNAKFNRRSWHPSEQEHISPPISPITNGLGKIYRASSIASSGASSAYSANSATIQIPLPGTGAYTKKIHHKRQESDPKYVRFVSAVPENRRQSEPERDLCYPGLVSHMTETQSLIFRRFDEVHVRLLLYLQDQIAQLETELQRLDEQEILEDRMRNGTFRNDADQIRVEIMERLRMLVGEYDTMILAFSRMQESKASEKAVGRLKDWLRKYTTSVGRQPSTNGGAIAREELEWVEKANDLTNLSISTTTTSTVVKQSPLTRLLTGRKRR